MNNMIHVNSQLSQVRAGLANNEAQEKVTNIPSWKPRKDSMFDPWTGEDLSWMQSPRDIEELDYDVANRIRFQLWWLKWNWPNQRWYRSGKHGYATDCFACGMPIRSANFEEHQWRCNDLRKSAVKYCSECKETHGTEYGDCPLESEEWGVFLEEKQGKVRRWTTKDWKLAVAEFMNQWKSKRDNIEVASVSKPITFAQKIRQMFLGKQTPAQDDAFKEPIVLVEKRWFEDAFPVSPPINPYHKWWSKPSCVLPGTIEKPSKDADVVVQEEEGDEKEELVELERFEVESSTDTNEIKVMSDFENSPRKARIVGFTGVEVRAENKAEPKNEEIFQYHCKWCGRLMQQGCEVMHPRCKRKFSEQVREAINDGWTRQEVMTESAKILLKTGMLPVYCRDFKGQTEKICPVCDDFIWSWRYRKHSKCHWESKNRRRVSPLGGEEHLETKKLIPLHNRFAKLTFVPLEVQSDDDPCSDVGQAKLERAHKEDWSKLLDEEIKKNKKEILQAHGFSNKKDMASVFKKLFKKRSVESVFASEVDDDTEPPSDVSLSEDVENIKHEVSSMWCGSLLGEMSWDHGFDIGLKDLLQGVEGLQEGLDSVSRVISGFDLNNPLTSLRTTKRAIGQLERTIASSVNKLRTPLVVGSIIGVLVSPFAGVAGLATGVGLGVFGELVKRTKTGQRLYQRCVRLLSLRDEIKRTVRATAWISVAVGLAYWSAKSKTGWPLLFGFPAALVADMSFAHGSSNLVAGVVYHLCKRMMPRKGHKELQDFLSNCREIGVETNARCTLFELCQKALGAITTGVQFVVSWMNTRPWFAGKLDKTSEAIDSFQSDLETATLFGRRGRIERFFESVDSCERGLKDFVKDPSRSGTRVALATLSATIEEGNAIARILQATSKDIGVLSGIRESVSRLRKVKEELIVRTKMTTDRVEPTTIWLAGPAGTGKTTFAQMLMRELVRRARAFRKKCLVDLDLEGLDPFGKESDPIARLVGEVDVLREQRELAQEVWTKSGTDKFWTGYSGQRCISWEEAAVESVSSKLQAKNTPAHQDFLTDFLQLVSQADFRPQMAAVEDKGTQVNPDFVVVTSNTLSVWTSGDCEAIRRRQHIPVLVYKQGDFSSDMSHLALFVPKRVKCTHISEIEAQAAAFGVSNMKRIQMDCGLREMRWRTQGGYCGEEAQLTYNQTGVPHCERCLHELERTNNTELWVRVNPRSLVEMAWDMFKARLVMRCVNADSDIFKVDSSDEPTSDRIEAVREVLKAHSSGSLMEDTTTNGLKREDFTVLNTTTEQNNCFFDAFRQVSGVCTPLESLRDEARKLTRKDANYSDFGFEPGEPVSVEGAFTFVHKKGFKLHVYVPEYGRWFNDSGEEGKHLYMELKGATGSRAVGHWSGLQSNSVPCNVFACLTKTKDMLRDALLGVAFVLGVRIFTDQGEIPDVDKNDEYSFLDHWNRLLDFQKVRAQKFLTRNNAVYLANLYDLIYRQRLVCPVVSKLLFTVEAANSAKGFVVFLETFNVPVEKIIHPLLEEEREKEEAKVLRTLFDYDEFELDVCSRSTTSEVVARNAVGLKALVHGGIPTEETWANMRDWVKQNQKHVWTSVLSVIAGTAALIGLFKWMNTKTRKHKQRAAHRADLMGLQRTRVVNPEVWGVPAMKEEKVLPTNNSSPEFGEVQHIPFYSATTREGIQSFRVGDEAHAYCPGINKTVFERIVASCGRIEYNGGCLSTMFCVQIVGSWFLCPAHLVPKVDRKKTEFAFSIKIRGLEYEGVVPRNNIRFPSDLNDKKLSDVMLLYIPDIPMGSKISQYMSWGDLKVGDVGTTLSVLPGVPPMLCLSRTRVISTGEILYRTGYEIMRYDGFSCGASTLGPGDCGTLMLKGDTIVGMYVAGGMSRSDFIALDGRVLMRIIGVTNARSEISCEISEIGPVIDRCYSPTFSNLPTSNLIPSGIADAIQMEWGDQPLRIPASLSDAAFLKGLRKFSRVIYPSPNMREVLDFLRSRVSFGGLRSIKSYALAAQGSDGMTQLAKPVELDTSAGLPWVDLGLTKRDLYVVKNGVFSLTPEFEKACVQFENRVEAGIVDSALCFAQLKDELRDRQRVEELKTRIFIANPAHVNLVFRKYLLPFMFHYKKNRDELYHAIGCDAFSDDWQHLADKATGRKCLALDFSRFDATHPRWLVVQCFEFVASFYQSERDRRMIVSLGECLVNFSYYHKGRVYMATGGQPSGSQVTTVLNSIINAALWLKCWTSLGGALEDFPSHCDLITFGDDCVLFADREGQKIMDVSMIQQEMAKMGYSVTAPDKSEAIEYVSLKRVQFLGRTFTPGPGQRWLPRRDPALVWSSLCWEHSGSTDLDIQGRIRVALMEFSVQDNWSELVNKLREFCASSEQWHRAWSRVPVTAVLNEFRRRVGIGGILGQNRTVSSSPELAEKAIPEEWVGLPELSFT